MGVILNHYVKDYSREGSFTSYENLSEVVKQFKGMEDCTVIDTWTARRRTVIVITKNEILHYQFVKE